MAKANQRAGGHKLSALFFYQRGGNGTAGHPTIRTRQPYKPHPGPRRRAGHPTAANQLGKHFREVVIIVIHYMVYQPPDENWQLACLCDDLLPEIVTVRRDNVTCPDCLRLLGLYDLAGSKGQAASRPILAPNMAK